MYQTSFLRKSIENGAQALLSFIVSLMKRSWQAVWKTGVWAGLPEFTRRTWDAPCPSVPVQYYEAMR